MLEGLITLPWWGYVVVALAFTHVTIAAVTIFLHRHQAHRALTLHPAVSHFFRFWLWLTTGMVTKEWAAIHRKHHAYSDKPGDPHSPQLYGIKKVLWDGTDLYRKESRNAETMEKYGHGTPDDWLEHKLYTRHTGKGIVLMLAVDLLLFGPLGLTIWAVQMIWIPLFAAGVINGVGHWWGYRNYECADTSTNVVPWGILIGGEELHNNHHTFASSAKLSSKWWEFDIGWMYIRTMQAFGLARVKKLPPELTSDQERQIVDIETVKAVITARFVVMARFMREVMHQVHRAELARLKAATDHEARTLVKGIKRLLRREAASLDDASSDSLRKALGYSPDLRTVYAMKQKLADIWQRSAATQEHLIQALQDWCREAEATGIERLREFAAQVRTYPLAPAAA